jgi:hypothetical protein
MKNPLMEPGRTSANSIKIDLSKGGCWIELSQVWNRFVKTVMNFKVR